LIFPSFCSPHPSIFIPLHTGSTKPKAFRADIEEQDEQEQYFDYLEQHKDDPAESEDEYDEDGNIISKPKRTTVKVPLLPIL
jgi:hypothetical protein